jgi:proteasome accessory factor B
MDLCHIAAQVGETMKNFTRPKYARIRQILEMIREGTRAGRYPNATDFRNRLGIPRRTLMRDLDFLRDDEGAPIEYDASRKGYRLTAETWSLPAMQLSRKEVFAFSVASRLLERFEGTPLELDVRSVLGKIADSMQGSITVDVGNMTERYSVLGEDHVVQDPEVWAAAARHVERKEWMTLDYKKFNGKTGQYRLAPYHMISYHGNWYILAGQKGRTNIATFALSRMRNITGTGETFEIPSDFDARKHMDRGFGIVRGDKLYRVRLLFSPKIATYIGERLWHPSQRVVNQRDGSLELKLETAGWKELVRWILSWQPDVKVLAPKVLRDRVKEKMRGN